MIELLIVIILIGVAANILASLINKILRMLYGDF